MIRRSHAATVTGALTLAVLILPAAGTGRAGTSGGGNGPAATSIGIKLLQAPASERNNPRAYEYIIDHLHPGTVIHRKFEAADLGRTAARVSVYAAAATISGGSFVFAAGRTQNQMTTWVSIRHPVLRLAPHQDATDVATIKVPRDATPGEQYGVIWAQVASTAGPGNVRLISRVGIRIYLSVGPGGAPASSFTLGMPAATRAGGRPVLRVPVHNTGGRAVDIFGTLALSGGPGGLRAGPFKSDTVVTLARRQSGTVVYTLAAGLPDGPWRAAVRLQSGLITRTGSYTVDFTGRVTARRGVPRLLVGVVAMAAILLAVALLIIIKATRRRRGPGEPEDEAEDAHASFTSSDYPLY